MLERKEGARRTDKRAAMKEPRTCPGHIATKCFKSMALTSTDQPNPTARQLLVSELISLSVNSSF
jgi:hypothetical protein